MIVLIDAILVTMLLGIWYINSKTRYFIDELYSILICIVLVFCLIITCVLTCEVMSETAISKKIVMYEEENTKIENQMALLAEKYMNYESETLKEFKPEESISLISLYPELKSDALVQKQLDVYLNNNNQIKALKEDLIDIGTSKKFLYFGK